MADPANLLPDTIDYVTTIADAACILVVQGGDVKRIPIADYKTQHGGSAAAGPVVATCKNSATQTNNSNTNLVDLAGMSVALTAARRYVFRAWVPFQTAATATGIGFGWSGPAMSTFFARVHIQQAAAGTDHVYENTSSALATNLVSTAVAAANTPYLAAIEAVLTPSANGTLQLRFVSEVNNSQVSVLNGAAGFLMDCG